MYKRQKIYIPKSTHNKKYFSLTQNLITKSPTMFTLRPNYCYYPHKEQFLKT